MQLPNSHGGFVLHTSAWFTSAEGTGSCGIHCINIYQYPCIIQTFRMSLQISDHLDIGRDESDEAKVESLSSIHGVNDPLFVKVR